MNMLSEYDQICLQEGVCTIHEDDCGTAKAKDCPFNLATRGNHHVRYTTNPIQQTDGISVYGVFEMNGVLI